MDGPRPAAAPAASSPRRQHPRPDHQGQQQTSPADERPPSPAPEATHKPAPDPQPPAAASCSVACQTEPNLIDRLVDNHVRRRLDEVDLYQEYVRSAQCTQFWPLDKNPIRLLVPSMLKVDLPEQHLKNESLMFDLVQAITTNSKLVNLLAKYIHHIVPNVIISKRIDLIPLITCTIRVCPDAKEQERLISLLFNLIKRPNEEQRRMILSGIIVVLQVSPHQNSSLLLPNLWDYVGDKFPERRILLAESCAPLAHYVRPIMRTNLVLSILIQLLKDKNAAVRSAACKSFSCLLTLIMDRNDEVFDACLSATEDVIQDMLQQTPVSFCEHRYELEQMRFCILETIYPLIGMWAVKLSRFKLEVAEFYLAKADKYFHSLLNGTAPAATAPPAAGPNGGGSSPTGVFADSTNHVPVAPQTATAAAQAAALALHQQQAPARASLVAAAVSKRRSMFLESRHASSFSSSSSSGLGSSGSLSSPGTPLASVGHQAASLLRRQSAYVTLGAAASPAESAPSGSSLLSSQRAINAYLRMLSYLVPFVFSDAVHSCAWLTRSRLHLPSAASDGNLTLNSGGPQHAGSRGSRRHDQNNNTSAPPDGNVRSSSPSASSLFEFASDLHDTGAHWCRGQAGADQVKLVNKLLEPTLIVDESAIVAFHEQLKQEHMTIESVSWLLDKFLPRFLDVLAHFSHKKFYLAAAGNSNDAAAQEFLITTIGSVRQLCLLFGKHLAHSKLRPLIKRHVAAHPALFFLYIASLAAFEPIEQQEYEEILASVKQNLSMPELTRNHVEITAVSVKILATNSEHIHSPSTRQKFLTYVLDALVNYSNQVKLSSQSKEFMLIMFRHILTCLIDPLLRPAEWAQILVTKFLPLLIMLANDSGDVYVCTYARLMCAQLVETFDNHLSSPKLTQQTASAIMPALLSLKSLTEQIKASNLKRQIDCLTSELNEKFFKQQPSTAGQEAAKTTPSMSAVDGTEAQQ